VLVAELVPGGAEPPILQPEILARIKQRVREIAGEEAREIAGAIVRELAPTITRQVVEKLAPEIACTAIRELLAAIVQQGD
jgi:hypothetical protein